MPEQSLGGSLTESAAQPDVERPAHQPGADQPGLSGLDQPTLRSTAAAVEVWRRALAGAGLPDTLLTTAPNASAGWLDLTHAHPSGLAQLFAGRQTRLSSLFRESDAHAVAWRQARGIRASTSALAAQRGVQGCCLAIGVAGWTRDDADGGRPEKVQAPVVLRACTVRPRGTLGEDFDLELDGALAINPELVRELVEAHDVPAEAAHLAEMTYGVKGFDPRPVYAWLEEHGDVVPDFTIERRLVLATFAAGSGAVLADLDAAVPAITDHRLLGRVAAAVPPALIDLAGEQRVEGSVGRVGLVSGRVEDLQISRDDAAQAPGDRTEAMAPGEPPDTGSLALPPQVPAQAAPPGETRRVAMVGRLGPRGARPAAPPAEPDPAEDLLALDLDPAQRSAVEVVLRGDDVLIEGPPGSGVTHTLAAAVARLVAAGRTVLVLSPRRASSEVLLRRLATAGLADLVLDLRDPPAEQGGAGRASSSTRLLVGLDAATGPVPAPPEADEAAVQALRQARSLLDGEVEALHEVREPWGVSAYDAMVALAELSGEADPPACPVRLPVEVLRGVDPEVRERLRVHLQSAAGAGAFTLTRADTRWHDAAVTTAVQARAALEAALILRSGLERARAAMDAVTYAAGLHPAHHAAGWLPLLELMLGVRATVDVLVPTVYEHDLTTLADAVAPRGHRRLELARVERRRLRKQAQALVRPGVHVPDLHAVLLAAADQKLRWADAAVLPESPRVVVGLSEAEAATRRMAAALDVLAAAFDGSSNADPRSIPLDDLEARVHDLAADHEGILGQPRRATLLDGLRRAGLGEVVEDFRARGVGPDRVDLELDQLWWASVRGAVVTTDPRLARHDPVSSRQAVAALRTAHDSLKAGSAAMIMAAVRARAARVVARHSQQAATLRSELTRTDRRPRLSDLVREAGDVLAGLAPVWLMSPDTVAGCLAPGDPDLPAIVDVVVLDDAGYVGMPEVVAAMARGTQVVVAGDRLRQVAGGSVAAAVAPFVTVCRLDRDHRAVDGRALTPLLSYYREGWQLTPGVETVPPLSLETVPDGVAVPLPGEELPISADAEVSRVVDLVEAHAVDRPEESLAVITLTELHAERIEQALLSAIESRPALARWLTHAWRDAADEPVVVLPVERALAVERDAAIVAVGLARTPHGRVLHRFGSVDAEHGPAQLIGALSRARLRCTVVCCFAAEDLVGDRLRTPGARLLRDVLLAAGRRTTTRNARSAGTDGLIADLRSRLAAAGLPVQLRVGDRSWPLDLGIEDPRVPGRMVVGVDLDGPAFASRTCGERERQRPMRWEKAGWAYCKVSSLDYFADPALEVDRIRAAFDRALAEAPLDGLPVLVVPEPSLREVGPMVDPDPVGVADLEPAETPAPVDGPLPSDDMSVGPDDGDRPVVLDEDDHEADEMDADPDADLLAERPPHW